MRAFGEKENGGKFTNVRKSESETMLLKNLCHVNYATNMTTLTFLESFCVTKSAFSYGTLRVEWFDSSSKDPFRQNLLPHKVFNIFGRQHVCARWIPFLLCKHTLSDEIFVVGQKCRPTSYFPY